MLPFPSITSLSMFYSYDRTDDFIESGQFGTVYRAMAMSDRAGISRGTEVAVKELSKSKISNEKEIGDIINEVEVLKRLNHRNCTRFVEAVQTNAHVFIVMELIDNAKDLFAAMREARAPDAREAWSREVISQLLTALAYLHKDLRVVHRDVKPENILITHDDTGLRVVLIDYGLAKYLGTSSRPAITPAMLRQKSVEALSSLGSTSMRPSVSSESLDDARSNSPMLSTPCGTLKYLAPETVRGLAEHGSAPRSTTRGDLPQSDVYAVGIILFAMLSLCPPFTGSTRGDLIRQMDAGPRFDGQGWLGISNEAKAFVSGLMNPNPSKRLTVTQALHSAWVTGVATHNAGASQNGVMQSGGDSQGVDRGHINNLISCASELRMSQPPPSTRGSNTSSNPNNYFSFLVQKPIPMDQS